MDDSSKGFNSIADWQVSMAAQAQTTGRASAQLLSNHNASVKDKQPKKPAWNIGTRKVLTKTGGKKEVKKEEPAASEEKPAPVAARSRSRLF